jgi:hypothetical protein
MSRGSRGSRSNTCGVSSGGTRGCCNSRRGTRSEVWGGGIAASGACRGRAWNACCIAPTTQPAAAMAGQ